MKAYVIDSFSGIEGVHEASLPDPQVGDDEVLIDVQASGVNPVDWQISEGHLKDWMPYFFPIILGWELAGIVEKTGPKVKNFQKGQKVYSYMREEKIQKGAYAEKVNVPAAFVAPMPENCSFFEAAAVPLTSLTAWQALDVAKLQKGQTIAIYAAGGGVGSFAVQFARIRDAKVIGIASEKKHSFVKQLGALHVIDYKKNDVAQALRARFPEGVDVVFDCVGGESTLEGLSLLKKGGTLVSIVEIPDQQKAKEHGVQAEYLFVSPNAEQLGKITKLFESGSLMKPRVRAQPFSEVQNALRESKTGHIEDRRVLTWKT